MSKIPFASAAAAIRQMSASYGMCIRAIKNLLLKSQLKYVFINYDILEARCYNVNNTSGERDIVVISKVAIDNDGELIAYDDLGNQYPLGNDEYGQDNYTLANLDQLVFKVGEFVDLFQKQLIVVKKPTKENFYLALKEYLKPYNGHGPNSIFLFEDGFTAVLSNGEVVKNMTNNELKTDKSWHFLRDLQKNDLRILIDAINEYTRYVYNLKCN